MTIGRILEITRYPVKSMGGESLSNAFLGPAGLPGDRAWAVRDSRRGDLFLGKRNANLMACSSRYAEGDTDPRRAPEIVLPDGRGMRADDGAAAGRLSAFLGQTVSIEPVGADRTTPDVYSEDEMREMLARRPEDELPDFSEAASESAEYQTRGMPYFDAFPLLLLTTRSLASLQEQAPESVVDARRFRPNLLLETDEPSRFPELGWIGRSLDLGEARVRIHSACIRCAMTTHGFAELPRDPGLMRSMVKHTEGSLGVYATVDVPGEVRVGSEMRDASNDG